MNLEVATRATPASVDVSYDAEHSYLYIAIDRRAGDPSPEHPLRSWTPFHVTFDYDATGRIRGVELMLPPLEGIIGTVSIAKPRDSYIDLFLNSEYTVSSEEIVYDSTSKILQVSLDKAPLDSGEVYALTDQLFVALRGGRLGALWLKGIELAVKQIAPSAP